MSRLPAVVAGAAGTTALNAVTFADMTLRARPATAAVFDLMRPGRRGRLLGR